MFYKNRKIRRQFPLFAGLFGFVVVLLLLLLVLWACWGRCSFPRAKFGCVWSHLRHWQALWFVVNCKYLPAV